jgi:beta-galactosidase/beta-glucuronidase
MYKQLFYTFLIFLLFFGRSNAAIVPLTGNGWTINNNGSYVAQGQIPGTIHTILLAANQIPEPFRDYNDVNLRYLIYSPWTFRKNFSLTDDFLSLTQFTLHLDQIDTVANITLNECLIGRTNNMFLAYSFSVMRSCLQSNNELRIDFQSSTLRTESRTSI